VTIRQFIFFQATNSSFILFITWNNPHLSASLTLFHFLFVLRDFDSGDICQWEDQHPRCPVVQDNMGG